MCIRQMNFRATGCENMASSVDVTPTDDISTPTKTQQQTHVVPNYENREIEEPLLQVCTKIKFLKRKAELVSAGF